MHSPAQRCGQCLRAPLDIDACLAAVPYHYPWDQVISQFKFRHQPGWAGTLATIMLNDLHIREALAQADSVIPMPLAAQRLRERGFNQAHELARHLAPDKVHTDLLHRTRETVSQATLPLDQRHKNLKDAFAISTAADRALQGKHLLLVDDVMTSGATLNAAARALRGAGVAQITGLVFARTDHD
jgi:ComF family protein